MPHIAPFGKGNDVRGTVTVMDQLREQIWACSTSSMVGLCQYRMSLDTVGRRLTEFKSSREFVGAIADAMEGEVPIISSLLLILIRLLQHMTVLSLMPAFFIMISV